MTLDTIAKAVGIGVGLTVAAAAVRRELRESRAAANTPNTQSRAPHPRWRVLTFVVSVASIAFLTTLLTQYVFPPYSVWSPAGYKPLLSKAAISLLWTVGLSWLLLVLVFQKKAN